MAERHIAFMLPLVAALFSWSCRGDPVAPTRELEEVPTPAVAPTPPPVEVWINPAYLSLHRGEEAILALTVGHAQQPLAGAGVEIEWHSTNPEVATVTPEGVVRALENGRTRIRAVGPEFMAWATVRVR